VAVELLAQLEVVLVAVEHEVDAELVEDGRPGAADELRVDRGGVPRRAEAGLVVHRDDEGHPGAVGAGAGEVGAQPGELLPATSPE
jgi:hypothetical protein